MKVLTVRLQQTGWYWSDACELPALLPNAIWEQAPLWEPGWEAFPPCRLAGQANGVRSLRAHKAWLEQRCHIRARVQMPLQMYRPVVELSLQALEGAHFFGRSFCNQSRHVE